MNTHSVPKKWCISFFNLILPFILQLQAVREELSALDANGEEGGEGRACALTALMLHCCAAAQLAQQRAADGLNT